MFIDLRFRRRRGGLDPARRHHRARLARRGRWRSAQRRGALIAMARRVRSRSRARRPRAPGWSSSSPAVLFVIPIFWIFSTSFKPTPARSSSRRRRSCRSSRRSEHYAAVLAGGFRWYLINSLIAASGATALGLLLGIPAAFGFAQYRYRVSSAAPLLHRRHAHLSADRAGAAVLPAVPDARPDRHAVRADHRLFPIVLPADDLDPRTASSATIPTRSSRPRAIDGLGVDPDAGPDRHADSRCPPSASRRSSASSSPGTSSSSRSR